MLILNRPCGKSLFNFGRFAQFILTDGHPATGVTHIVEFPQLGFADMSGIAGRGTAILTGIGAFDFLGAAQVAFLGSHKPTGLALIDFCLRCFCLDSSPLSFLFF